MGLIYHYTDIHGLFGILAGKFWLSDHRFLNDPTEGIYALQVYDANRKELLDYCAHGNNRAVSDFIEKEFDEGVNLRRYVGSFSEKDLLSQWRGYCPPQGGYCIGFEDSALRDLEEGIEIHPCTYSEEKTYKEWREIIQRLDKNICRAKNEETLPSRDFLDVAEEEFKIKDKISTLSITHKNPNYKDEREHRLIYSKYLTAPNLPKTKYRKKNSYLIPYIELKYAANCIEEVMIGPSKDFGLNCEALQEYKLQNKLSFNIKKSKIPYRG